MSESTPSGFPTLQPALITKVHVGDLNDIGVIHNGSRLMHFATPTGTLETVPGFEPAFKANIDFRYQGVIKLAPEVQKIFNMQPDAATVPFGFATGQHQFLVADAGLKRLEHSTFVSNGRILVGDNGLTVETRQSLVLAASVMD